MNFAPLQPPPPGHGERRGAKRAGMLRSFIALYGEPVAWFGLSVAAFCGGFLWRAGLSVAAYFPKGVIVWPKNGNRLLISA